MAAMKNTHRWVPRCTVAKVPRGSASGVQLGSSRDSYYFANPEREGEIWATPAHSESLGDQPPPRACWATSCTTREGQSPYAAP